MRRGRDISNLHLSVSVGRQVKLKRYTWICEVCGREYIARNDAEDCEDYHHAIKKASSRRVRDALEDLRNDLDRAYQRSQALLAPSR